jgi:hypothetical protein
MQQTTGFKIIFFVTFLLLSACVSKEPVGSLNSTGTSQARSVEQTVQEKKYDTPVENRIPSCSNPTPEDLQTCQELEQQLLGYTVRIEIEAWIKQPVGPAGSEMYEYKRSAGDGHATVMDGRYLLTHNHFDVPASALADLDSIEFGAVSIYTADGRKVDTEVQPPSLSVTAGDLESLVLDFGMVGGQGYFASLGLPSAQFVSWGEIQLESGAEVAQVDWDGRTAHVKWASVESIVTHDGPPHLILSGGIKQGASGGGVFLNGYHVANNWTLRQYVGGGGDVQSESSTAALNSAELLAAADL